MTNAIVYTGCAGWSLPRDVKDQFDEADSNLERYASRLNATEINSSFYRPHQRATYERWAASVPGHFRFSVKLPKMITHENRLVECSKLLSQFLEQAEGLQDKFGCLLAQLPPSLAFDVRIATRFFRELRSRYRSAVGVEPRHASWFTPEADALLQSLRLSRVLADPVLHDPGRIPGGCPTLIYLRLHGSPRAYWSSYSPELLDTLATRIGLAVKEGSTVWCVFDNTASGAATHNALGLHGRLARQQA